MVAPYFFGVPMFRRQKNGAAKINTTVRIAAPASTARGAPSIPVLAENSIRLRFDSF